MIAEDRGEGIGIGASDPGAAVACEGPDGEVLKEWTTDEDDPEKDKAK